MTFDPNIPTVISAIGDKSINPLFTYHDSYRKSGTTCIPHKLPEPKSSLKKATKIKIIPYPIAFPIPSKNDFQTPLPRAKASAFPSQYS